jgi:hypothetical protein
MLLNRSAPHARVVPILTVGDVRAAVDWYGRAWGFVERGGRWFGEIAVSG